MNNNQRIIFIGFPLIAREYLQALINNKFNVIAVYTKSPQPQGRGMVLQNSSVHQEAIKQEIPVQCPKDFKEEKTINTFNNLI